jgi:hypothetical protein
MSRYITRSQDRIGIVNVNVEPAPVTDFHHGLLGLG